jgi:hypothetical protein
MLKTQKVKYSFTYIYNFITFNLHIKKHDVCKFSTSSTNSYHLMSVKPIAVTIIVEGRPNFRWFQNVNVYEMLGARRACSQTIKFAAEPNNDRFPATVLTQAKMSHALFSSSFEIAAAEAATLAPSNRTRKNINTRLVRSKEFLQKS